jgi:hypothetical protein
MKQTYQSKRARAACTENMPQDRLVRLLVGLERRLSKVLSPHPEFCTVVEHPEASTPERIRVRTSPSEFSVELLHYALLRALSLSVTQVQTHGAER